MDRSFVMGAIEEKSKIEIRNLNKNNYTISLLQEALRVGLIDNALIANIQGGMMEILSQLILRYTNGQSSSVTVEIAERLFAAILYAMDASLEQAGDAKAGIEVIRERNIMEVYEKGIQILSSYFEESKNLYRKIRKEKLPIPIEAYDTTICEGIPQFLAGYNIVFDAHNTMADIDYPLFFDDMSVRGVKYIRNYLRHLDIETEFCKLFSVEEIEKVLSGFGHLYNIDYRIELVNIFEVVLSNSIFSVLTGDSAYNLSISKTGYDNLEKMLHNLSRYQISSQLDGAVEILITDLKIKGTELVNYIKDYKESMIVRMVNALNNGSLHNVVVIDGEDSKALPGTIFESEDRVNDKDFRSLMKAINICDKVSDKISIIKARISSLSDFMDILDGDCFYGEEYEELFEALSDEELGFLCKVVFSGEFRCDSWSLTDIIVEHTDVEREWQKRLVGCLMAIDTIRLESIESYIRGA